MHVAADACATNLRVLEFVSGTVLARAKVDSLFCSGVELSEVGVFF